MKNNPFETLAKVYEDSVAKADEEGTAEVFRAAAQKFFNNLIDELGLTVHDIQFQDGYYIFGMGTNSVVHFHIKECSGWKFGIWWNKEEARITGDLFAQYEQAIDKFKPTASVLTAKIRYQQEENGDLTNSSQYDAEDMVKFIQKYPLRAWGRDVCYMNYNLRPISSFRLHKEFIGFHTHAWLEKIITKWFDKYFVDFTIKLFKKACNPDELNTFTLSTRFEEHCIPKYELLAKVTSDSDQDTGCFGMFDSDSKEQKLWNKRRKQLDKIADIFGVWWPAPIHDSLIIYKENNEEDE